jgi:hypothetical protein
MTRDEDYIGSVAYDCGFRAGQAHAVGLLEALEGMLYAVCHETGFAAAVRHDSGKAYPWAPLEIAEERARAAIAAAKGA